MKILHVEDTLTHSIVMKRMLSDHGVEVESVPDIDLLKDTADCDAAVLDLVLPNSSGAETVLKFVRRYPFLPVVVLTACRDQRLHEECIKAGASSVLEKGISADAVKQALDKSICQHLEQRESRKRLEQIAKDMRCIANKNGNRNVSTGN